MELLSGLPAGEADASGEYPESTFNYKIQQRIAQLQKQQKQFARSLHDDEPDTPDEDKA